VKLIFEILMGFVAFGSVAVLFASIAGFTIWAVWKTVKALMD
jgi:hypothetical protein